jgi:ornithine cyclodeaminase/alanine dehydrogenase
MAVFGCGVQGRANLAAARLVQPQIDTVCAYACMRACCSTTFREMSAQHGVRVVASRDAHTAIFGADVVVTCCPIVPKPSRTIEPGWLKPKASP